MGTKNVLGTEGKLKQSIANASARHEELRKATYKAFESYVNLKNLGDAADAEELSRVEQEWGCLFDKLDNCIARLERLWFRYDRECSTENTETLGS